MAGDNYRLAPMVHHARDILADDGLAEDGAIQDIADGAVGALPHLLEAKFGDPSFVGGDGGALNGDTVLPGCVGRIDGDLIVGLVPLLDGKIVILEINIQVRENEALADPLPNNARHLVSVHFDDGALDLNFRHASVLLLCIGD